MKRLITTLTMAALVLGTSLTAQAGPPWSNMRNKSRQASGQHRSYGQRSSHGQHRSYGQRSSHNSRGGRYLDQSKWRNGTGSSHPSRQVERKPSTASRSVRPAVVRPRPGHSPVKRPGSGFTRPGYGKPSFGRPSFGRPSYRRPGYRRPVKPPQTNYPQPVKPVYRRPSQDLLKGRVGKPATAHTRNSTTLNRALAGAKAGYDHYEKTRNEGNQRIGQGFLDRNKFDPKMPKNPTVPNQIVSGAAYGAKWALDTLDPVRHAVNAAEDAAKPIPHSADFFKGVRAGVEIANPKESLLGRGLDALIKDPELLTKETNITRPPRNLGEALHIGTAPERAKANVGEAVIKGIVKDVGDLFK